MKVVGLLVFFIEGRNYVELIVPLTDFFTGGF